MPTYLDNVEEAKNRPDKSILAIRTMCPEKLLVPNVAFPEQVRHLWLDVNFDQSNYCQLEKYLFKTDCNCPKMEGCNLCSWYRKYTNTLCKDLVGFDHLETLTVYDLNLSSNLWTQFAQNSKHLKQISFISNHDLDSGWDEFEFDDERENCLQAIFQIPTLEKISFSCIYLPLFPKGPSNIKYIELDNLRNPDDKQKSYESYKNFCHHTNITTVSVTCEYKFAVFQFEKMTQLQNLNFMGELEDQNDIDSLKRIFDLPNLKTFDFYSHKRDISFCGSLEDKEVIDSFKTNLNSLFTT